MVRSSVQNELGIDPVIDEPSSHILLNVLVSFERLVGKVPDIFVLDILSSRNDVISPMLDGNVPVIGHPTTSINSKLDMFPMVEGRDPEILLLKRIRLCSVVRAPMLLGSVPTMPSSRRDR